jgi:hypothetical protein
MEILGFFLAIIGAIPFVFDLKKYSRILKIRFSDDDFIIENARVTFDVKRIDHIQICITSKYKILKNDPILNLPFTNRFGNIENFSFLIDNIKINPSMSVINNDMVYQYKITNKNIGETLLLEAKCMMDSDPEIINKKNDGLAFWLDYYKCQYLKLFIIFPPKFHPYNISFAMRPTDFSESTEIEEEFGSKSPFLFTDNRRAVEWPIEYPKFMKAYRIGWSWVES